MVVRMILYAAVRSYRSWLHPSELLASARSLAATSSTTAARPPAPLDVQFGYPCAMSLDPRLAAALRSLVPELQANGRLFSTERLARLYALFRARFGPEVLLGLDGRDLLLKMHGRGEARDSLAYWLEFKNDDEFPTTRFGGIAGGNALKFGIYRRAETGQWMTGTGTRQLVITEEEAVAIAEKQRSELSSAARLLERARVDPVAVDYLALQRDIERAAPELHHLGWVHKYLSLLAPEVLDDYHATAYQRYYLLKLRLRPLAEGLYANGGLFQAAARELGLHVHQLATILNHHFGMPRRVWKIGTGSEAYGEDEWPAMRDRGYVAIGWYDLGDLRTHLDSAKLRDQLQRLHEQAYPDVEQGVRTRAINQIGRFLRDVALGDTVLAVNGTTVLGIGEVTGDYQFLADASNPHSRAVRWLDRSTWKLPINEKPRQAVTAVDDVDNLLAVEERLSGEPAPSSAPVLPALEPLAGIVGQIAELLDHKPQLILHGPPGTGKTFWATRAACELAARDWYGRSFAALSAADRQSLTGPDGPVELCTFHPGYGYEDFVEGLRPKTIGGQLAFELKDGLFKRLCVRASAHPGRRHFLVIDELNRGDLPRIFGELLTLLERDKRGTPLTLALSQERFSVPANVVILATMNTADRSIALLDAAFRRRFAFLELMPDPSALGDAVALGLPLGPLLTWINDKLLRALGHGMRQLQIGHAYLMHDGQPITDPQRLAMALRNDVLPLLEEYCYEDRRRLRAILGAGLFRGDVAEVDATLFEPRRLEQLASALQSHFADQLRTPEVVDLLARSEVVDEDA